jgi:hypothetical protein
MPAAQISAETKQQLQAIVEAAQALEATARTLAEVVAQVAAEDAGGTAYDARAAAAGEAAEPEEWCETEPPAFAEAGPAAMPERAAARTAETPAQLADRILEHPNIGLATKHPSGRRDNATARQNIIDTAAGQPARRSAYGNAPGGTVRLDPDLLRGLLALAETYRFHISELCGGSHSRNSRHYSGTTADITYIDGEHVGPSHPDQAAFRRLCRNLGAVQVFGPGDRDHSTHIHAAWPL